MQGVFVHSVISKISMILAVYRTEERFVLRVFHRENSGSGIW